MGRNVMFEKVYSVQNSITADLIIGVLKNNGIMAYRQGEGPGGIMGIYGQNSIFGESIYVDVAEFDRAKKLIEEFLNLEGDSNIG